MNNDTIEQAIQTTTVNTGETLADLSRDHPVLLIFLRHLGCTFCREAAKDIADQRDQLDLSVTTVLVHMTAAEQFEPFVSRYKLEGIRHIPNPNKSLYKAFGLERGNLFQLFGPTVFLRGFQAGIINRHLVGKLQGDGFQMPGVFLIDNAKVTKAHIHKTAADRPNYTVIAS